MRPTQNGELRDDGNLDRRRLHQAVGALDDPIALLEHHPMPLWCERRVLESLRDRDELVEIRREPPSLRRRPEPRRADQQLRGAPRIGSRCELSIEPVTAQVRVEAEQQAARGAPRQQRHPDLEGRSAHGVMSQCRA